MSIHAVYNRAVSLDQDVRRYIETHRLFRPGDHLVLGVSGGPDSLCLLDVLTELSGDWSLTLYVAHLNHGLRAEAAAEAERVRAEAEARGWRFFLEEVDAGTYAAGHKLSREEAARVLRYDFLARTAQHVGASIIAVAHTADDQAETVLMHFLRGSGLAGLRGMLPKTKLGDWRLEMSHQSPIADLYLVRPLLSTSRASVEAYCAARRLKPVYDPSNADTTFFRNRLRHELLPLLQTYNPNIRAVLGRTSEVLAGEFEIVRQAVEQAWQALARVEREHIAFDLQRWRSLDPPLQRALLRRAVSHLRAHLRDVDFVPIETAVRFSRSALPGRVCDVVAGLCLAVEPGRLVLRAWDYEQAMPDDLPLLDENAALTAGWRFLSAELSSGLPNFEAEATAWRQFVDAQTLTGPLHLRAPRPGDRFQPLGLAGHSTKLSDFFTNRKVPVALRSRWPLVVSGEAIVWVAGLRLDERFKVTENTRRVMRLEFVRREEED
ncbi:MAG: tRNA lysidine(34) synthetase TilS [Anaerolineales bacterium]|nr:tRNA lysidine(34) synthetase TilS [Anaerolineales bacterium]